MVDRLLAGIQRLDRAPGVHASWTNQIEIFFSIVQRKVIQPNDFTDLAQVRNPHCRISGGQWSWAPLEGRRSRHVNTL
ncbi:hypothetical protein [Streptomyces sp. BE230]|uniref:hypothetical protein n=1 Tax=Streptomyces sp. BE230 TaxID=3002526 RepID=UPI002ED05C8A|nr:hypothetical protein [Streptomyces sp. BE230]